MQQFLKRNAVFPSHLRHLWAQKETSRFKPMLFKKGIFYSLFLYFQINKHTNTGDSFLTSVCLTSLQQRPLRRALHSPWFIHTSARLNQCCAAPACGRKRHVQSFRLQLNSNHFFCLHTDERQERVIACGCARQHIVSAVVLHRWVKGRALPRQGCTAFKNKSIRVLLDFKY